MSKAELLSRAGWTDMRAEGALSSLLGEGLALVDDGAADGQRLFWFPCLSTNQG